MRGPALVLALVLALAAPAGAVERGARERAAVTAGAPLRVSAKRGNDLATFVRRADRGDLHPGGGARGAVDKAADWLARHGELFGLARGAADLAPPTRTTDPHGWTHVTWRQRHAGVEVFGATLRAHLGPDGALRAVNGAAVAIAGPLGVDPAIDAAAAARIARAAGRGAVATVLGSRLVVYDRSLLHPAAPDPRLAWAVETGRDAAGRRDLTMVDALDGRTLDRFALTPHALTRQVSQDTLANVVWVEGDPDPIPPAWAGGTAAQVAAWQDEIDGARESYHFHGSLSLGTYLSFDGADAPMLTRHAPAGLSCPNASWNGVSTNYCPGVTSDDVVSHEWGHAYTQFTSDLVYAWQPGALNESYSDVWGETVDLLNGRGTDAPGGLRAADGSACSAFGTFDDAFPATDATYRWLVSEDASGFAGPIRDMWHPECRFDPGRVGSPVYHCATSDGGGVHTNSGVPNHLYALLVDGGAYNGETVAALGLTKAAAILWRATSVYETQVSDFSDHADAVEQSCTDLIGASLGALVTTPPPWTTAPDVITTGDCDAVAAAVAAVELRDPTPCPLAPILNPNAPALCAGAGAVEPVATADFEGGLAPWTAGTRDVANPSTYDGGTFVHATTLPDGRAGAGAFTADPIVGDCDLDDESGVSFLESPAFVAPTDRTKLRIAFAHWIATEPSYDGGNVKVSVNGGAYQVVPTERFAFNPYNLLLNATNNTSPMAGEPAWSGTDAGSINGSWGESHLDLAGIAAPGDTVRLRFELGMDGCNGNTGWYLDDVRVHTCSGDTPLCPPAPIPGCKTAPLGKSKLALKATIGNPAKSRLQWSWSKGAATALAELGDPLTTTRYGLCVWDGRSGVPELVASTEIPAGPGWKSNLKNRVRFADGQGLHGGVARVTLRTGAAGKASAAVHAKGSALDLPVPATPTTRFAADPAVIVQLASSTGTCWESTFTAADLRSNTLTKAQALHKGP